MARWWGVGILAAAPGMLAIVALVIGLVKGLENSSSQNLAEELNPYTWHVLGFTLKQAMLSTCLSIIGGLVCALRLLCCAKPKRKLLVDALILCFVLPSLVVVFAVIALFGYNGLFNNISLAITSARIVEKIYGLPGILVAHVFFNTPLVAYVFLQRLENLGQMPFRLASELQLSFLLVLRHVVFPCLRPVIAGVSALIFSLCLTSFTVVLLLGGGPRATTLSLAIFESIRVDFDPSRAAFLSCIQIIVSFLALSLSVPRRIARVLPSSRDEYTPLDIPVVLPRWLKTLGNLLLALILFVPIYTVASAAIYGIDILREKIFYDALLVSILLGSSSAIFCCLIALPLLWSVREGTLIQKKSLIKFLPEILLGLGAYPLLAVPPIVLATGLLLLLQGTAIYKNAPLASVFIALVGVNAMLALPIVLQFFAESFYALARNYSHLWRSLDISPTARFLAIDLPAIRRSLQAALACAFCLSLGDLSAIALFGRSELMTLPYLAYLLMGRYRWQEAGFCIAVLVVIYFLLFRLFAKGIGGKNARA